MFNFSNFNFKYSTNKSGGFVVLFTVLISSIILAIALGISSVSLGEVVLSGTAKEGNTAFFAADAGAECALYFDRVEDTFDDLFAIPNFSCNENILSTAIFKFNTNPDSTSNCVKVRVEKIDEGARTRIESRGYNVSCEDLDSQDFNQSRTIERAIRVTYNN